MEKPESKAISTKKESKKTSHDFAPVSCLLTVKELDEKADELYSITWNGVNRP